MYLPTGTIYGLSTGVIVAVVLLALVELVLMVWAVLDIVQRPAVLGAEVDLARDRRPLRDHRTDRVLRHRPCSAAGPREGGRTRRPGPTVRATPPTCSTAPARKSRPTTDRHVTEAARPRRRRSRSGTSPRPTGRREPSTASTSPCPRAPSSAFSGPTAPARRRRCASSPGSRDRPRAARSVLGHDVVRGADEVRALIGFLPDVPGFYKWMTAPRVPAARRRPLRPARRACCASASTRCSTSPACSGVDDAHRRLLARHEAAARRRPGAHQRAAPAAARRAHERPRPHRPPRGARHDRGAGRPHDGVLLDAHPRRRGARLRHGRHPRPRTRRRAGRHRRAQDAATAAPTASSSRSTIRRGLRRRSRRSPGSGEVEPRRPRAERRGHRPRDGLQRAARPSSRRRASPCAASTPPRSRSRRSSSTSSQAAAMSSTAQPAARLASPGFRAFVKKEFLETRRDLAALGAAGDHGPPPRPRHTGAHGGHAGAAAGHRALAAGRGHQDAGPDLARLLPAVHGQPRPGGAAGHHHHRGSDRGLGATRRHHRPGAHQTAVAHRLHRRQGGVTARPSGRGHRPRDAGLHPRDDGHLRRPAHRARSSPRSRSGSCWERCSRCSCSSCRPR